LSKGGENGVRKWRVTEFLNGIVRASRPRVERRGEHQMDGEQTGGDLPLWGKGLAQFFDLGKRNFE